jgi:transcriptional regulator with XRE-family HTH domain
MAQNEAERVRQKITGVLLRQARTDAGKTLKDCGNVLGLSSGAVSAVEHGRRSISLPEIELLAYYFGVPLERLLYPDAKPERKPVDELPSDELLALRHRIIGTMLRRTRLDQNVSEAVLARQAGISKKRLTQYEMGEKPIPLTELETLAEALEIPMARLADEGIGPIGERQKLDKQIKQFTKLDPDLRRFILEPDNEAYLRLAVSLSEASTDKLRNIAGSLLEITM